MSPTAPRRIQRQRTKGWRMPEGAVVVTRPSRWGNPFVVFADAGPKQRRQAVADFRVYVEAMLAYDPFWLDSLRGRDLLCWCPLVDSDGDPVPCHADVLLELANA